MKRNVPFATLALGGALFLAASSARADTDKASSAAAQALFDEGKKLLDQGKASEACPKFAESQRLDPGGGTLMFLAVCYEKDGKTASAYVAFNDTLSMAIRDHRADRERIAKDHLSALTPRLRKLVVSVPPDVAKTTGLVVEIDGAPIAAPLWGTPMPIDPGPHKLVAKASGKKDWEGAVESKTDGETVTTTVPALADGPASTGSGADAPAEGAPRGRTQRLVAIAFGAVGVVGVGVGSAFGLISMSKHNDAEKHCSGKSCQDNTGVNLRNDAVSAGNVSTVGFIAGGVLLGAGVALYLTAPRGASTSKVGLVMSPQPDGVWLGGQGTF